MVLINYEIIECTVYPTLEDAKEAVLQTMVARGESLKVKKSDKKNGWQSAVIRTASSV
jgi:hypothetical protein